MKDARVRVKDEWILAHSEKFVGLVIKYKSQMQKGLINWENTLENKSLCKTIRFSAAQH